MFCYKCGHQNDAESKFCMDCGAGLIEDHSHSEDVDTEEQKAYDDYEDKMLEAFIGNNSKLAWYKNAFSKYNKHGIDQFAWHWSWWSAIGGFWFLLYRKTYFPALVIFIIEFLVCASEISTNPEDTIAKNAILIFHIGSSIAYCGSSTYFIYKKYRSLKKEIEDSFVDTNKRIDIMKSVGGTNKWVIWFISALMFAGLVIGLFLLSYTDDKNGYNEQTKSKFTAECMIGDEERRGYCECIYNEVVSNVDFQTFNIADDQFEKEIDGKESQEVQGVIHNASLGCSR